MHPKCLICTSPFSLDTVQGRPVALAGCGHVFCYGCFQKIIRTPQPYCPFRCNTLNALTARDGTVLDLTLKERDFEADSRAVKEKKRVECGRASSRVHKMRRDMITLFTSLVNNQENVAARRISYITRDAAKAEKLREAIVQKQSA
ncbi:hypothetical protein C8T65DRAFT_530999, partial [Cerioporus squamosus]